MLLQKNKLWYKLTAFFLVTVLTLSPLNVFFNLVLKAETWVELTSAGFSQDNYSVKKLVQVADEWLFILPEVAGDDLSIYQYHDDTYTDITTFLREDPNMYVINDIAYVDGYLYMAVGTSEGPMLYRYDSAMWTDVSNTIPAGVEDIEALESIYDTLLVWTFETDGESTSWKSFYYVDELTWSQISDADSFGLYNTGIMQFRKAMVSNGNLVVLLYDGDTENTMIYRYNNDAPEFTWFNFLENSNEIEIVDMVDLNGDIYLMTGYGTTGAQAFWFADVDVIAPISETGFGNIADNLEGKLTVFDNTLYAAVSRPNGGYAQLYRYDGSLDDGEWLQVSSFIGLDDVEPGTENSWVTSIIPFQDGLVMGAAQSFEGLYWASVWYWGEESNSGSGEVFNTGLDSDDDCTEIDLGFDFDLYDQTFDSVFVNTNGTLNFLECYSGYGNVALGEIDEEEEGDLDYSIFPMWFDIDLNGLSSILYSVNGEAPNRTFTIQWTNAYTNELEESIPLGTFQVILSETTNTIQFQYKYLMQGNYGRGREATIGILKDTENFVQYSYNQRSLFNGKTIKFTPDGDSYEMTENVPYIDNYLVDDLMPSAPVLVNPSDNEYYVPTNTSLSWENSEGGDLYGYDIVISTDPYFEAGIYDDSDDYDDVGDPLPENKIVFVVNEYEDLDPAEEGISTLYLEDWIDHEFNLEGEDDQVFTGLEENTKYYWFVMALGDDAYEISEVRSFCTGSPELCISDLDGDNIPDDVENDAPNNGDANNDNILDSEQANVASFINTITNDYVVLEVSCDFIADVSVVNSDTLGADTGFSYPGGLLNFELLCEEGETATITQYFYGLEDVDVSLVVARKYFEVTGYKTITDAEISNQTIGGLTVLVISYEIEDGGELDEDGVVDGVIIDPSGPALNSAGVPNTGLGGSIFV